MRIKEINRKNIMNKNLFGSNYFFYVAFVNIMLKLIINVQLIETTTLI